MNNESDSHRKLFDDLRAKVEQLSEAEGSDTTDDSAEMRRLIQQLEDRYAELERENEELRTVRPQLDDLYREDANLSEFAPCGYFTLDSDGYVVRCNVPGAKLLNDERENVISTALSSFVADESQADYTATLEKAARDADRHTVELKLITQEGKPFYAAAEIQANFTVSGKFQHWCVLLKDISEQRKTRNALEYRLEFEDIIFSVSRRFININAEEFDEAVNDALGAIGSFVGAARAYLFQFHYNQRLMSNTHEWCAEGVTSEIEDIQDYPVENMPWLMHKLRSFEIVHVPRLDALSPKAKNLRQVLERQNIKSIIVVPMINQNELVGFVGFDAVEEETEWSADTVLLLQATGEVLVNALERRKVEVALQKSEQKYRQFFALAPWAITLLDNKGRVLEVNRRLEDWLGYKPEEVLGQTLWELPYLPQESKDKLTTKFAERMSGQPTSPYELEFLSRNGQRRTGLIHATPLRDAEGNISTDLVLISDITESKRAQKDLEESNHRLQEALDELRSTQQQLVDQERQRALAHMASGIAHDFNNALSPIQGYTELLLADEEIRRDQDTLVKYLQRIQHSADTAAETVRRMRKFYRPTEEDVFTHVDLDNVIEEAVFITEPRWKQQAWADGKAINVETDLNGGEVCGNEGELHEVLTNLIFNAVDAISEQGTITIRSQQEGGYVVVEFSDNGGGMSPAIKQQCFDPFYTTKGPKGDGLGLSTLQGVVSRHGGDVTLDSEAGEGTTFYIRIPLADPSDRGGGQNNRWPCESLRILVLESDEIQREALRDLLSADGHDVDLATDCREGIDKFSNTGYDVVFTDRAMPGMSGDQFAANIKETVLEQPVVMLTGFGDIMNASGEKPENVDTVLSKPVTREKLRESLGRAMEG